MPLQNRTSWSRKKFHKSVCITSVLGKFVFVFEFCLLLSCRQIMWLIEGARSVEWWLRALFIRGGVIYKNKEIVDKVDVAPLTVKTIKTQIWVTHLLNWLFVVCSPRRISFMTVLSEVASLPTELLVICCNFSCPNVCWEKRRLPTCTSSIVDWAMNHLLLKMLMYSLGPACQTILDLVFLFISTRVENIKVQQSSVCLITLFCLLI